MANRNERKRLAKARNAELTNAVANAFVLDSIRKAEKAKHLEALISNDWVTRAAGDVRGARYLDKQFVRK